jgi:hypothetical protein
VLTDLGRSDSPAFSRSGKWRIVWASYSVIVLDLHVVICHYMFEFCQMTTFTAAGAMRTAHHFKSLFLRRWFEDHQHHDRDPLTRKPFSNANSGTMFVFRNKFLLKINGSLRSKK